MNRTCADDYILLLPNYKYIKKHRYAVFLFFGTRNALFVLFFFEITTDYLIKIHKHLTLKLQ